MRGVLYRIEGFRRVIGIAAVIALAAVAAGAMARVRAEGDAAMLAYSTANLVRLHIIANSDSEEDQRIKLAVRDRVIEEFSPVFKGVDDADSAERLIRDNLHLIEEEAADAVRQAGKAYGARAVVGRFPFPPRVYGQMALPEGEYRALRIVLGEGEGRNWWCVMFPPLCFVDAAASGDGGGREGIGAAPGSKPPLKSFVVEWVKERAAGVRLALRARAS